MNATRIRRLLGLILLVISISMLVWGLRNFDEITRSVPILPADMRLPTPESLIWQIRMVI